MGGDGDVGTDSPDGVASRKTVDASASVDLVVCANLSSSSSWV